MRKAACALTFFMIAFGGIIWLMGCGDADLLDERDSAYIYSMQLEDAGELGTLTVDIVQVDCDGNFSTTDDIEEFTDLFATINVKVATDVAGLRLDYYTLEYIPLPSADSIGNLITAPTIAGPLYGYANLDVAPGATASMGITMMSTNTKVELANAAGFYYDATDPERVIYYWPDPWVLRYTMRVTLHFTDYGDNEKEFILEKTAYFSNYDNC